MDPIAAARQFVDQAPLPALGQRAGSTGAPAAVTAALDAGKTQAAVVGSGIISFVQGVTAERREAILHSSLLAQLVATSRVGNPDSLEAIERWYGEYAAALRNIGWAVQDLGLATYQEQRSDFDAHQAILDVATALLGPATPALALVKTALQAMQSMNQDEPWIRVFHRESRRAETAHFQITLVDFDEGGAFLVPLMAFGLQAESNLTQVLFFKAQRHTVTLKHHAGRVTINAAVLDGVRDAIRAKLAEHAKHYVATLPELPPIPDPV